MQVCIVPSPDTLLSISTWGRLKMRGARKLSVFILVLKQTSLVL